MIKDIIFSWARQYLPILINSICTAVCLALAGCKLTASDLSIEVEYPATYHNSTNSTPSP